MLEDALKIKSSLAFSFNKRQMLLIDYLELGYSRIEHCRIQEGRMLENNETRLI